MKDFELEFMGLEFQAPSDIDSWLEVSAFLSPAVRRRAEAAVAQWRTELGHRFLDRLNRDREVIADHFAKNEEAIDEGSRKAAEIAHQVRTGRLTPNDGLKELGRLSAEHQQALAVRESLEKAVVSWEERAETDGEAQQREMSSRFKSVRWSRTLSHRYLEGKEPSPFTKRGPE